jgi:Ca2+-binding RTX toxin-like protein
MVKARWNGDSDDHGHDDWHESHDGDGRGHEGDEHGHRGGDHGHDWDDGHCGTPQFNFDFPENFKVDLSALDLSKLGKITDFVIDPTELSITFGNKWTFSVTGSDFDVTVRSGHKLPIINDGTVDSFSVDGPGKADFSISGLDIDAVDFTKALTHLQIGKLFDMVLGGDETISGSGFADLLFGAKGNDTIRGNDGSDELLGGKGNDILDGGQQSDLLIGGDGADTFIFGAKSGMDLIFDFDADTDKLDLTGSGFTGSLSDLIGGHGGCHGRCFSDGDVVLDLGNGSMVKLLGVSASELNTDNVLL